MLNLMPQ